MQDQIDAITGILKRAMMMPSLATVSASFSGYDNGDDDDYENWDNYSDGVERGKIPPCELLHGGIFTLYYIYS